MIAKKVLLRYTLILFGALLYLVGLPTSAQELEVRKQKFNVDDKDIAVEGYDVVSYFFDEPKPGKNSINYTYKGIIYHFSTEENREIFSKNPEKFEPAYGGWCSYAMGATGETVKIDPKTFKIIAGKLYLFYNFYFNNTLIDWNKDEVNLLNKANENWTQILDRN